MPHCDLLLKADCIVTQDDQRRVLDGGFVAVEDGRICATGGAEEMDSWEAREFRDLGCALILPGLINAHTHTAMTFLRGFADDLPLLTWLEEKIFPLEAHLTSEIAYTFSLLGFAEMLATGTTSCLDMYIFEKDVLKAAQTAGIGLALGEGVFAFPSAACHSWQHSLALTEELADQCRGSKRHSVFVSPHALYTTNPEILHACLMVAEEHSLPLHIHLAESADEVARCRELYGSSPIVCAKELGILGWPCSLAHVVAADSVELNLLVDAPDCVVLHNPSSNMKLASGIANIPEMSDLGIPIALGTDGPASNNSLNMFGEMKCAALLHKVAHLDPEVVPATMALDFATLGGARALHRNDIGQIAPGMRADLTVLDLTRPNLQPLHSPISHAVYAASGHEVILTMVEGEILYDHGRFTRFSWSDLLSEVNRLKKDIHRLANRA